MTTHGILGQHTSYPTCYNKDILFGIERQEVDVLGFDYWHAFEVSFLLPNGLPFAGVARFVIPASSPRLIESKSFKLYLNSLNFWQGSKRDFIQTVEVDLSAVAGASVTCRLLDAHEMVPCLDVFGICLEENADKVALIDNVDPSLIRIARPDIAHQSYHSHLLRSNCPVTCQPDWGSVLIEMEAPQVCPRGLLEYILSFRKHNGFHEACVMTIYHDLMQALEPDWLLVRAWYTRRGGLDINPVRASHAHVLEHAKLTRLIRQ